MIKRICSTYLIGNPCHHFLGFRFFDFSAKRELHITNARAFEYFSFRGNLVHRRAARKTTAAAKGNEFILRSSCNRENESYKCKKVNF